MSNELTKTSSWNDGSETAASRARKSWVEREQETMSKQLSSGKMSFSYSNLFADSGSGESSPRPLGITQGGSTGLRSKKSSFHLGSESEAQHIYGPSGSEHTIERAEAAAFSTHVNITLSADPLLTHLLPLNPESTDIFTKNKDGLILIRLINRVKELIDIKTVNKDPNMNIYQQSENLNKVIAAASQIGCHITNIGSSDIIEGR
jgi:hypothetical protein